MTVRLALGGAALLMMVGGVHPKQVMADDWIYTTRPGDTLWSIGEAYLRRPVELTALQNHNQIADPKKIPPGTQIKIPVSAMRLDASPAEVIATTGSVTSTAGAVTTGSKINEGDKLTTSEGGFVTIKLADGSMLTVQPKSSVRMETVRQLVNTGGVTDTVVRLDSGRVETRVAKQRNSAARYEIRTPTSNMGVRGTVFRVGADESGKRGQGEVVEGLVAVSASSALSASSPKSSEALALGAGFGTFVEDGKPPSPPIALLSAPDVSNLPAQIQSPDARFTFPAVPSAVSYRAHVALDSAFTNLIANASSPTPDIVFVNLPDGALFVRMRGVDVNGLEGKDAARAFSVKARPLPPALTAPIDTSRILSSKVTLLWLASADAVSYRVQLASDDSFANPALDEKVASGVTLTPSMTVKPVSYYWRVASLNAKGETGPWSPARSFIGVADVPILRAKRAAGMMPLEIDASSAQSHQVQIARDERFTNMASDRTIAGNKFELGNLAANAYYVRVRAVTGSEKTVGPWSEPRLLEVYPFGGGWWLSVSHSPAPVPANR